MSQSTTYDAIVIGAGVVGAATAYYLRRFGKLRVLVLERGAVCSGGTAKSCAIIRSHYSIPSNTQLTLKSLGIFADFAAALEDSDAHSGFINSGYLIVAAPGKWADGLRDNLAMQSGVGADTHVIDITQAHGLHPGLNLADVDVVGYEPNSGYADPYLTTSSYINAARKRGVTVKTATPVTSLIADGGQVVGVRTSNGDFSAAAVVSAIGPWTQPLLATLGYDLHLEVSRHIVLTFRGDTPYAQTTPVVKDLTASNKMYFRPASGGVVLTGTGDHGDPVTDPESMDAHVGDDFVVLQGTQLAKRMPAFSAAQLTASWIGPYDITPDWNPVLGPLPGVDGLHVAYGFSGHGFKLSPAVGYCLAQQILGQQPDVSLHPYRWSRFADGELLHGRYGEGSIS
ncbi:MAG: FAD-binding oxidoreductase [Gammaproteobacteria bacterium]|nr:FAD-binding oxidoreductase [Gammaproteobacteria bacterium]